MPNPRNLKYTKDHEWVKAEADGTAVIGITHFAQEQLGDIVYLDVPKPGKSLKQFEKFGEIESVKSVSDLFTPISGEVLEFNYKAVQQPELVNKDPYGEGWLLRVRMKNPPEMANLISAEDYEQLTSKH